MNEPEQLFQKALEAREKAYAPYSNYLVGAALLCEDGSLFVGCNVENASFGLTVCAERNAIFSAVVAGKRDFKALAIVVGGEEVARPCGACLQVICEFNPEMTLYLYNTSGKSETCTLRDLLPTPFRDFKKR